MIGKNETYKYLGNIKRWHQQTSGDEKTIKKRVSQENDNTWAVPLIRYSGPFLMWTKELKQMEKRKKRTNILHKALHPRDDVDRIYTPRKGWRGLASSEDNGDASI